MEPDVGRKSHWSNPVCVLNIPIQKNYDLEESQQCICKAAFAAVLAMGAFAGGTLESQAGRAGAKETSCSETLQVSTKAYHKGQRRYSRTQRYDRSVHGHRYRSRRSGYTYQYAGYWYSAKWWVPVRIDSYADEDMSHAEWCEEQYGDYYDPRTNTYEASDGRSYRCIRPCGD